MPKSQQNKIICHRTIIKAVGKVVVQQHANYRITVLAKEWSLLWYLETCYALYIKTMEVNLVQQQRNKRSALPIEKTNKW